MTAEQYPSGGEGRVTIIDSSAGEMDDGEMDDGEMDDGEEAPEEGPPAERPTG